MGRKIIVTNLNDPTQLQLWEVEGHTPENYLFDAPANAERIVDLDIDLDAQTAVINESRYNTRLADEAAAKIVNRSNNAARAYLSSTDWYILRELDSGVSCPQEIKDARAAARASIV